MYKEIFLIVIAICCVFSIIPLSWINYASIHWPQGAIISVLLLSITVGYAVYDAKKLFDNKNCRLAKNFSLSLTLAIIISLIFVSVIWQYARPPLIA
jgi:hypothetical protein